MKDPLEAWKNSLQGEPSSRTTVRMDRPLPAQDADATGQTGKLKLPLFPEGYKGGNLIGAGGMGRVFEGEQLSLQRSVALKLLNDENDPESQEAFRREALLTGALEHPVVPPVYDLEINSDGSPFLVMKKVEGELWETVIDQRTLDQNLEILLRVADGVAFAHANHVIHRDIKPENIRLGHFGEVYLMDWGLAIQQQPDGLFLHDLGGFAGAGTPAYMAPEMALAIGPEVGYGSDIYLLGAILFEIVTGYPPHPGKTATESLVTAADNEIIETEAEGECLDIALKALSTESENRFKTVQEFQKAIRDYREHAESLALCEAGEDFFEKALEENDYSFFAEAQSSFKQALRLWPENESARKQQRKARLANARLAFREGDLELAASQLEPSDEEEAHLLREIDLERSRRLRRQRQFKHLQRVSVALLAVIAVGFLGFSLWVQTERSRAETALEELQAEQEQRQADRRQSAPALTVTAKRLISYGDLDAARAAAEAAREFDPSLLEADYLRLGLTLQARDFTGAARVAEEMLEKVPTEIDARELQQIAEEAARSEPSIDPALLARITPILGRHGMSAIGAEFALTDQERLEIWKKQLRRAWPGFNPSAVNPRWAGSEGINLNLSTLSAPIIEDLSPLSGIPIAVLNLSYQRTLSDLSPLQGMPLRNLSLQECEQITDLSPLAGLPLETLDLERAGRIENLEDIQGLQLHSLNLGRLDRIESVEPLRGMPLRELDLNSLNRLTNIDALEGMPLTYLSLSSTDVRNIQALNDMPLETLFLRSLRLDSYEPLRGMPLRELYLDGSNFENPALLAGMSLTKLSLVGTDVTDISELRGMPLENLQVSEVRDVAPLKGMPLRKLSLGDISADDPPENLDLLRGLPLKELTIEGEALVRDLSWLDRIQLDRLTIDLSSWRDNPEIDFSEIRNASIREIIFPDFVEVSGVHHLRRMDGLEKIGYSGGSLRTVDEFLSDIRP